MNTDPTDAHPRERLCAWCGTPVRQSGVGRPREYCRRTCRELAYRERVLQKRIAEAVAEAGISSTDESVSSTDVSGGIRVSSTDGTESAAPIPAQERPAARKRKARAARNSRTAIPLDWSDLDSADGGPRLFK